MRYKDCRFEQGRAQGVGAGQLRDLLDLKDYGQTVSALCLARCLLVAATWLISLSASVRLRLRGAVSDESVRMAWKANLPKNRDDLLKRCLPRFQGYLPRGLRRASRRRGVDVAIDYHGRPFYGDRDDPHIVGGKEKKSTKWFWTYATAAVVHHGERWTLAVTYVAKEDSLQSVVRRLLDQIEQCDIKIRLTLLDSGFYSAGVIDLLQARKLAFILPVLRRGTKDTGTQPFFQKGLAQWQEYTRSALGKKTVGPTVTVWVATMLDPSPPKNREAKQLVYACSRRWKSLTSVAKLYAKRFGIESSYRQFGECLAKTTSNDPVWRFALFLVAVWLRNLWVLGQEENPRLTFKELLASIFMKISEQANETPFRPSKREPDGKPCQKRL